jgi:transcription elongation factor
MSTEVTVGLGNLMGYELYDLVMLNENESAVVIGVGAEKLKVVNHMDIVKEIFPQEVQAKRNLQSQRSSGFDSEQNTVVIGDVVNVTSGPHAKLTGTVKHMMKGSFWLHSNMYLKNSGIFVTRGRYCIIAGAKSANHSQSKSQLASQSVSFSKPIRKVGKDENIGNTLRITKGQYKGLLCQVIDTIGDSYIVELLAKLKKITIEKSKTVIVGTKHGSLGGSVSNGPAADGNIPQTPSYSLATPYQYQGMATPRYGADTPGYQTPNPHAREEDNMIWSFNANFSSDRTSIPQSSSNSGNDSRSDPYNFSSSSRISSSPWIGESESSIVASARGNNRSPQSPFESNASQTSSLYSPSNGADTSSINPGMNGGRNASGGISFRDWVGA